MNSTIFRTSAKVGLSGIEKSASKSLRVLERNCEDLFPTATYLAELSISETALKRLPFKPPHKPLSVPITRIPRCLTGLSMKYD